MGGRSKKAETVFKRLVYHGNSKTTMKRFYLHNAIWRLSKMDKLSPQALVSDRNIFLHMCGNPRRYHTQDVVRMSGQSSALIRDLSGPLENNETEGERQLKLLLDKQLNTQTTVKQQLAQSRQFSRSTLYKPSTEDVSGIVDLSDYKSLELQDQRVNELRSCGLTDEEIQLKLNVEQEYVEKRPRLEQEPTHIQSKLEEINKKIDKHRKLLAKPDTFTEKRPRLEQEPTHIQSKLEEINKKIDKHRKLLAKPDTFTGQTLVGRHAMDLEKSLVKDNKNSKCLSKMLIKTENSSEYPHPDHPMNHIPEILEEVAGKKLFEKKRHHRKRKNKSLDQSDASNIPDNHDNIDTSLPDSESEIIGCKTKGQTMTESNNLSQQTSISCDNADVYQDSVCDIIVEKCLSDSQANMSEMGCKVKEGLVHQIPDSDIIANRLSLDEIRQIPKFEKYEEGNPNNVMHVYGQDIFFTLSVFTLMAYIFGEGTAILIFEILYIKNLPSKVTENELGSLFLRYQTADKSPITFRIMTGKMRGQAFVTFNDTETATQSLKFLNGYKLQDKPIIIQYGKK